MYKTAFQLLRIDGKRKQGKKKPGNYKPGHIIEFTKKASLL
jgi:hypothetical protein